MCKCADLYPEHHKKNHCLRRICTILLIPSCALRIWLVTSDNWKEVTSDDRQSTNIQNTPSLHFFPLPKKDTNTTTHTYTHVIYHHGVPTDRHARPPRRLLHERFRRPVSQLGFTFGVVVSRFFRGTAVHGRCGGRCNDGGWSSVRALLFFVVACDIYICWGVCFSEPCA
jgi:hypothetical protein